MSKLLIKISGELFSSINIAAINHILKQVKELATKHSIALVLGGGNFFRGAKNKSDFGIREISAHNIGMLATMVNGIMLQDLFAQNNISSVILSAFSCSNIAQPITQNKIITAFEQRKIILFVGGTGNPFFTTDTNAVLRALQIGADEVWKATKVDGIYDADPHLTKDAKLLPVVSYQEILDRGIAVMDRTAITLAQKHAVPIRVFNMLEPDAFHKALENPDFGSRIR